MPSARQQLRAMLQRGETIAAPGGLRSAVRARCAVPGGGCTVKCVAQFLAVCSRSTVVSMSPGDYRRDCRLCRRSALPGEAIRYATARFNVLQSMIN